MKEANVKSIIKKAMDAFKTNSCVMLDIHVKNGEVIKINNLVQNEDAIHVMAHVEVGGGQVFILKPTGNRKVYINIEASDISFIELSV